MAIITREQISRIPKTISETIYRHIKSSILEGEFKPEQRILEKDIAEFFQVSTTPVREAFQRLSAEQYLIINARKEVVVVPVTKNEIQELFEVVQVLDAFAATNALPHLNEKDIEDLKKITDKLSSYHKKKEISTFVKTNIEFHKRLWKSCQNIFLYRTLLDLADRTIFFGNQIFALKNTDVDKTSYYEASFNDHMKLMKAVEDRDIEALKTLCLSHWGNRFL